MLLAIGPLILSLILAWIKFRSGFLALSATTLLCFTVLLAYVILPVEKVSLASFLGVFMIFGLGFSSFFRMHELWRRSRLEAVEHWERLMYLYTAAGREMLPVVCTSLCYFLLLTSNLVPLREFGIFIGTSMLLAVAFALLCFVPILLLHEVYLRPCLRRMSPRVVMVLEPAHVKPNWEMLASKIMLLLRRPKPLLAGTALVVFICSVTALAVTAAQPYPELPEVFPHDHHREAGRPLLQTFRHVNPAEVAAPFTIQMCEPGRNLSSCALHWCDLQNTGSNLTSWPSEQAAACSCYAPLGLTTMCSNITVSMTISGSRATALSEATVVPQVEAFMQTHFPDADYVETSSATSRRLQSVVLEDWPTGATHVDPMTEMPQISLGFPTPRLSTSSCHETHLCYCSPKTCTNPTGYRRTTSDLSLPALSTTTEDATSTSSLTSSEVVVLFGISKPFGLADLLAKTITAQFDSTFDPASPWAQRAMLRVCEELPTTLQVLTSRCWILDFRTWLYSRGQKFPVERFLDFHQTLKEFLVSYLSSASAMWFNEGNNLTATMFTFQVTPTDGATATLAARDLWNSYIDQLNSDAASTASNAWATSQVWVDAVTLQDALSSAWQVLLAVTGVVFLVGLFYVLDLELVLALLLVAFCVCSVIVFFFFCLCGWSFGPWELTILTVFLSYSIEPAFHIGHDFINPGLPEALRAEKPLAPDLLSVADAVDAPAFDGDGTGDDGTGPPQVQAPRHADGLSQASEVNPKAKDTPEEAIQRSIHLVAKNLVSNSLKLLLCGILLAFSQLRIFSRLGAISILLPLLVVPSVLLVYPAIILASGRQRREPDVLVFGNIMINKLSWLWT